VKFNFFLKTLNIKLLYELIVLGIEIANIRISLIQAIVWRYLIKKKRFENA